MIGLDGGGTKVEAAVGDAAGGILGRAQSGPCNIAAMTPADAFRSAQAACSGALASAGRSPSDVIAVCAAVAGASYRQRRNDLAFALRAVYPNALVTVEPDYAAALTGGTAGAPGIVVIAGTGSIAYGESSGGQSWRAGGYGYLVDDDGSGYGVGRRAIDAVFKAEDHRGRPTALSDAVLSALSLTETGEIVPGVYGGVIDRVRIASLAQIVAAVAGSGDEVARAILMQAGGALGRLAAAVADQLFAGAVDAYPIVMVGGLWQAGIDLTDVFQRSVHRFAPAAVITPPRESPVVGAVWRALSSSRP